MTPIVFFKLQAKNLLRDYKTRTPTIDVVDGRSYYAYDAEYFDIDAIFMDFGWDEDDFSLMKAQHTVAVLAGFRKWTELARASVVELELAKLLFDHQDKMNAEEWAIYIAQSEDDNRTTFGAEDRLEIYKQVVLRDGGPRSETLDYRLMAKDALP
ncbi:hypothetical protein [Bradyrhizobium tunisiense]|uniref:hypothetical protein n=1 Tax=Bradyrhizobium tunisiense TaxID=3278709 RepID=UPI0035DADDF1